MGENYGIHKRGTRMYGELPYNDSAGDSFKSGNYVR